MTGSKCSYGTPLAFLNGGNGAVPASAVADALCDIHLGQIDQEGLLSLITDYFCDENKDDSGAK